MGAGGRGAIGGGAEGIVGGAAGTVGGAADIGGTTRGFGSCPDMVWKIGSGEETTFGVIEVPGIRPGPVIAETAPANVSGGAASLPYGVAEGITGAAGSGPVAP